MKSYLGVTVRGVLPFSSENAHHVAAASDVAYANVVYGVMLTRYERPMTRSITDKTGRNLTFVTVRKNLIHNFFFFFFFAIKLHAFY